MSKLAHMFYAYRPLSSKKINFCCFRALAYTTLDRHCAIFFYVMFAVLVVLLKLLVGEV